MQLEVVNMPHVLTLNTTIENQRTDCSSSSLVPLGGSTLYVSDLPSLGKKGMLTHVYSVDQATNSRQVRAEHEAFWAHVAKGQREFDLPWLALLCIVSGPAHHHLIWIQSDIHLP